MVQDRLAVKILDGTVLHGDHVLADAAKDGVSFKVSDRKVSDRAAPEYDQDKAAPGASSASMESSPAVDPDIRYSAPAGDVLLHVT